jgi:hypothetical protein
MISLKQPNEPFDIDLPYGITVTVKPLSTTAMAAAQAGARRRVEAVEAQVRDRKESGLPLDGLPDLSLDEERDGFLQCQVVYELAARQITSWIGIEDDPPVTRDNIIAVMDLYPVGEQFLQKLTLQQMLLNAAKNASGLSASGTSSQAEGPGTAKGAPNRGTVKQTAAKTALSAKTP